ncbi:tripeptidyl-peptidase [Talaromyces proteolyticus]|uniref:tripeptidyl-peptidase II n=1 Tax=Talaromyces proteolyticus TaxID=1131652 RepID=A0AAD4KEF3_9EURO|nr:tripeptidyl-peptidase [Talaromyces proteolyticus]KAH8689985.1 tripeptidyl-peptidase [Talaromyces proteolyticus]
MFGRDILSVAALSLLASSATGEVIEKLRVAPEGWKYTANAPSTQKIRLQIALQQNDAAGFEQAVLDMATPGNAKYGQHFQSHDEMKQMLLPSDRAAESVVSWLQSAGVTDIAQDADWIDFTTTVGIANELLDTQFQWYTNQVQRHRSLRTLHYSVPDDVAEHIYMIQPTTRFGGIRPMHTTSRGKLLSQAHRNAVQAGSLSGADQCGTVVTPTCLKKQYGVGNYTADPKSGSKIAFSSYLKEYARYDDLAKFEKKLAPWAIGQNFTVIEFNNGQNNQTDNIDDSGEANLDLQYILGLSSPLPVTEFSTGGLGELVPDINEPDPSNNQNEPYLDFLKGVLKLPQDQLPQVISTSYGEDEQTIPPKYAESVCDLYKQLGSRGVSVIFSSGDSGVGSGCVTNDGKNTTHFLPQFPATCPWVTSVGATQDWNETAAAFSSGGFSDLWARPSYQDDAVAAYLATGLADEWEGLFNKSGRGFPDVSAQGVNFAVYDKGSLGGFEGTSASGPTFAAIVALLNDARLRAGKSTLGFLNPWIYSKAYKGLNDVTTGGSAGCNGLSRFNQSQLPGGAVVPGASWKAAVGWDPVTGYGTPNFPKLKALALAA